jgi:hypothetical protein
MWKYSKSVLSFSFALIVELVRFLLLIEKTLQLSIAQKSQVFARTCLFSVCVSEGRKGGTRNNQEVQYGASSISKITIFNLRVIKIFNKGKTYFFV